MNETTEIILALTNIICICVNLYCLCKLNRINKERRELLKKFEEMENKYYIYKNYMNE